MAELTIITQNLNGWYWTYGNGKSKSSDIYEKYIKILKDTEKEKEEFGKLSPPEKFLKVIKEKYMNDNDVHIYAFQEVGKLNNGHWSNITETIVKNPRFKKDMRDADRAEEIWYEAFPWNEFRSGYWDECDIEFAGNKIKIINFHSAPHYDLAIRYTLLKRLSEIQDRLTILLGDFNAAFRNQTESPQDEDIIESEDFLKEITRKYKFIECKDLTERNGTPHYTHSYTSEKDGEQKCNKLDHIFMSRQLFRKVQDSYKIEYIDKVNLNPPKQPKKKGPISRDPYAFTDHSGIKLTIELPGPEADSKQAEG